MSKLKGFDREGNIAVEKKGACFKRIGMTIVKIEKRRRRRRLDLYLRQNFLKMR
jgi:hypothetical protein